MSRKFSADEAVVHIHDTITLSIEDNQFPPYFFIAGAGISAPEIPCAKGIIQQCREELKKRNEGRSGRYDAISQTLDSNNYTPMEKYSLWIEKAYPNKIDRRRYFKSIISNAKISAANILLAQILQSRKVSTTVFTTNFDQCLEGALRLIGSTEMFIADNSHDNLGIEIDSKEIQISHIHGSYKFYDCANLKDEIEKISRNNGPDTPAEALKMFLKGKAPIVIGYSGWENDLIMACLKERLQHDVPRSLMWVCYNEDDYNGLPNWIKDNEDVIIVMQGDADDKNNCDDNNFDKYVIANRKSKNLPADILLGMLISELGIEPPILFTNPYLHYSELFQKLLPDHDDVFNLKYWAERMKFVGADNSIKETAIKEIVVAYSGNDYTIVSDRLKGLAKNNDINASDCAFIFNNIISPAVKKEHNIAKDHEIIEFHKSAMRFISNHSSEFAAREILGEALIDAIRIELNANNADNNKKIIEIVKMAYGITKDTSGMLYVCLECLEIMAKKIDDKSKKIIYLDEIIKRTNDDKNALIIRAKAMIQKALVVPDYWDATTLLQEAEALIEGDDKIRVELILAKIVLSQSVENSKEKVDLIDKALYQLRDINLFDCDFDVSIRIFVLLVDCSILHDKISSIKMKDVFENILSKHRYGDKIDYYQMCLYALIANAYLVLGGDLKNGLIYMKNLEEYLEKGKPIRCELYIECIEMASKLSMNTKEFTLKAIIYLGIVRDKYGKNSNAYRDVFAKAATIIEKDMLVQANFEDEVLENEESKLLSAGYDMYAKKEFNNAEDVFLNLMENGCSADNRETSALNIAFMLRRNETVKTGRQFIDIIKLVDDRSALKQVNIILYYLSRADYSSPEMKDSYDKLLTMNSRQIADAYTCWKNVQLVGSAESEVAVKILDSVKNRRKISMTKIGAKYRNELKQNLTAI